MDENGPPQSSASFQKARMGRGLNQLSNLSAVHHGAITDVAKADKLSFKSSRVPTFVEY